MNDSTPEQAAIKKLMSHRLSLDDDSAARMEWLQIVEGTHTYLPVPRYPLFGWTSTLKFIRLSLTCRLWEGISSEKRELLRSFLRYVESDISKLSRPNSRFDFRNGSIGNFFLTGARLVPPPVSISPSFSHRD